MNIQVKGIATVMIIMIKREKKITSKKKSKKLLHALKHAQRKHSQKDMNAPFKV